MSYHIEWVDSIPSTNASLREQAALGVYPESGFVLAAHAQTAGRGRFDRVWFAPPGACLTFSLCHRSTRSSVDAATLPMTAALGIVDMLRGQGIDACAKWPNDVLVHDRKICGILSERVEIADQPALHIIGIGLNVNLDETTLARIDQPAISMMACAGHAFSLETILRALLASMAPWLTLWDRDAFAGIRDGWTARAAWIGERVTLTEGSAVTRGELTGFGEHGELILKVGEHEKICWSGDLRRDSASQTSGVR